MKRKKPCTADHVIGSNVAQVITSTPMIGFTPVAVARADEEHQLCVSISPTEEPVQLSHKPLGALTEKRNIHRPDDLRASKLIDRYVDQIHLDDDNTFVWDTAVAGDRLSIVSPLAKRLAEIRLRRSSPTGLLACNHKRKRTCSDGDDTQDPPETPTGKRPKAAWWWLQCSGGDRDGGLTLPDDLASPFPHSSYRHRQHHLHYLPPTVTPSPITPLRSTVYPDDSDDYWKTPIGPSLLMASVRGDSPLSSTSSKMADDDIIGCCSNPRSPTVLDETSFTLKSRRCLSFVSPPPSDKKKNRRSLKKNIAGSSASTDKGRTTINYLIIIKLRKFTIQISTFISYINFKLFYFIFENQILVLYNIRCLYVPYNIYKLFCYVSSKTYI